MSNRSCRACEQLDDICPHCEQTAEARSEAWRYESDDRNAPPWWGR